MRITAVGQFDRPKERGNTDQRKHDLRGELLFSVHGNYSQQGQATVLAETSSMLIG
jgi:hypothetical protein